VENSSLRDFVAAMRLAGGDSGGHFAPLVALERTTRAPTAEMTTVAMDAP
jgi:hypothetical protein